MVVHGGDGTIKKHCGGSVVIVDSGGSGGNGSNGGAHCGGSVNGAQWPPPPTPGGVNQRF